MTQQLAEPISYGTLNPARIWKPKKRKGKKRSGATENWYPTKGNIKFLSKSQITPSKRAAWYKDVVERARIDPNTFIEFVLDNTWETESENDKSTEFIKQSWFHEELHKLLNKGTRGLYKHSILKKYRYVVAAFPRGGGKTTQIVGRILWELGRNPNLRIKLIAETKEVAQQRVYEIKRHIEKNNYLHAVFPNLIADNEDQWTNSKLYIKRGIISRDPTIIASGVLGSATGGRADLLIGDDVVGRRNALTRPKLRKEVISSWWSVWYPQLAKGGRCWYICTPWHKADLSHNIVKNDSFITFLVPVGQNCETPWPERWSVKDLEEKRKDMGESEFARAYWLEASEDSSSPIESSWIRYINKEDVEIEGLEFLLSFDMALGKKSGDYFAGVVLAIDRKKKLIYVVDFINEHILYPDQIKLVESMIKKWNARWIVFETTGMQDAVAYSMRESKRLKHFSDKIFTYKPKVSKRLRLEATAPKIESGDIVFLKRLTPYNHTEEGLLLEQILDFGIEEHDDISDAFVQGVLWAQRNLSLWQKSGISVTTI